MKQFEEVKVLLDNSTLYYLLSTDLNGIFIYANNCFKKAYEEIIQSLIGESYSGLVCAEDLHIVSRATQMCFKHPRNIFPVSIRIINGNNGYIVTKWELKAILNEEQQPKGILWLGYDITKQITNNLLLEDTLNSLDEKANILENIAFSQSHLMRKPVANILGLCLLLRESNLNPEAKKICELIFKSAVQIDELIHYTIGEIEQ